MNMLRFKHQLAKANWIRYCITSEWTVLICLCNEIIIGRYNRKVVSKNDMTKGDDDDENSRLLF